MLKSITLKSVATYDDHGAEINDLQKINFIYGANGSGKTTIANFIQNPEDTQFKDCSLEWKGNAPVNALVYNKIFRKTNFKEGKMNGVFTVGQATAEEIDAIDKMKEELAKIKEEGIQKKINKEKLNKQKESTDYEFKEEVWISIYKKHETDFSGAFEGLKRKDPFKDKIISEFKTIDHSTKSYDELKGKANILFGKSPSLISPILIPKDSKLIVLENDEIWSKKIVGKADVGIADLIQKLNLDDWVNEGKRHLEESSDVCPFCQQHTITDDFKKQLEEYFDELFLGNIQIIKNKQEEYKSLASNLMSFLQEIKTKENSNEATKLDLKTYSDYLDMLNVQIISNEELFSKKLKEPSRSIKSNSTEDILKAIEKLISDANIAINEHNKIVEHSSALKAELINDIWEYLIEENRNTINSYLKKSDGLQKSIKVAEQQYMNLQNKWKELKNTITEASKNVTSVQPSIDEINKTLRTYGFLNFEIVPSATEEKQYQIQREDGTKAEHTLSEGEVTFITFLYFLQLTKGSVSNETIEDERILIVDDPISSLDSTVLFVVGSLLKEIIKKIKKGEGNIKQLIVLTHNVYFHKEVSFIDCRTKGINDAYFWTLRKTNKTTNIQAYQKKNPIQNSYELLWQELKEKDKNSGITIQNTMRKIIENYFKILGKYGDEDLINKFENSQEKDICRSLVCWINDGSHCIPDDLFIEEQGTVTDKFFDVFKKIFEEMDHIEHYNMMMRITEERETTL